MAYVAPKWKNGAAPALDAAALQAISDAIVELQNKNTSQDSLISSLQSAVNGKARVAFGTYTGTGAFGSTHRNRITLGFAPFLFMCTGTYCYSPMKYFTGGLGCAAGYVTPSFVWLRGPNTILTSDVNSTSQLAHYSIYPTWGDTFIDWYSESNAECQLNALYTYYNYLALG